MPARPLRHHHRRFRLRRVPSRRGQSLVEFALLLPLLIVLLLGVADFGRVFREGIALEAATRNGAEAAAQEYVQIKRNAVATLSSADYQDLHTLALDVVCRESTTLSGDQPCSIPYAAVCVHDLPATSGDPMPPPGDLLCGSEAGSAPSTCPILKTGWDALKRDAVNNVASDVLPYVEVRTCYRFKTSYALSLPFGLATPLSEVWLERTQSFTVGLY